MDTKMPNPSDTQLSDEMQKCESADAEDMKQWATEVAALEQRLVALEEALEEIIMWSKAYPIDVFPEPNFKKAHELLQAGGMTLDAISASNMRHVIEGVGEIAQEALRGGESD